MDRESNMLTLKLIIICMCTHFITAMNDKSKDCLVEYDKKSGCLQGNMCPEEGEGVIVETVEINEITNCLDRRYTDIKDKLDSAIMAIIRRECNGRRTCALRESLKSRFLLTCSKGTFVADAFRIAYQCKPVGFQHSLVYNIGDDLQVRTEVNTFYLVMSTTGWDAHRSCDLDKGPYGFSFNVTLLHVDLELPTACTVPGDTKCPDVFKLDVDEQSIVTYRTKSPPMVPMLYKVESLAHISITVSSAFVWLEVKAPGRLHVNCTGNSKEDNTTSTTLTMTTQMGADSTSSAGTSAPVTCDTSTSTTTNTTATVPYEYIRGAVYSSDVLPYIATIAVLASVSLISLVLNAALLKKYCDQRKIEKEHIYSYPSVSIRDGSYTYSGLDDESTAPKVPMTPRGVLPLAENEYLQVASYDTEYLDIEHKEYNIPQDNSHSITDNTNY